MGITAFFEKLGAPLKNQVWSWGAVSKRNGDVLLRVWSDERKTFGSKQYVVVTNFEHFGTTRKPGWLERLQHVEKIKNGAQAILVFCYVKDGSSEPRSIAGFHDDYVWEGRNIEFKDGNYWIEVGDPIAVEAYLSSLKK